VSPEADDHELIPAATVILLRDGASGMEVLMLRRNSRIAFGGMWVFPGGRVDDHEVVPGDSLASARIAAAREVHEEAGLVIDGGALETWSYWIPPNLASLQARGQQVRRFSTWFFVVPAPDGEVAIDDGEIHEHLWLTPTEAKARRDSGEIELAPPTWVTLHQLEPHATVAEAMAWARVTDPDEFRTRPIHKDPMTLAWFGDAAYHGGSHDDEGPRHRLTMLPRGWDYQRLL
jgi:8-oxo-dGTP pyrophosphatase MutT (NUDIX family)